MPLRTVAAALALCVALAAAAAPGLAQQPVTLAFATLDTGSA